MDVLQSLYIAIAAVVGAVAAWVGTRSHYGRQLAEQRHRVDKLEKARQVASQHYAQAQAQIEQLQKDLHAAHKAQIETRANARSETRPENVEARRQALSDALDAVDRRIDRPRDFADTQPA